MILVLFGPSCDDAHLDTRYLRYSNGGVAANRSGRLSTLKSLATIRQRTLGVSSSPLFTSTQRTLTGFLPVTSRHSAIVLISQTPISSTTLSSSSLAALTRLGFNSLPEMSSQYLFQGSSVWDTSPTSSDAALRINVDIMSLASTRACRFMPLHNARQNLGGY